MGKTMRLSLKKKKRKKKEKKKAGVWLRPCFTGKENLKEKYITR
jgi:hypothetical protein